MKRAAPSQLPQGPQHYWAKMVELTRSGTGFTVTDVYKQSSQRSRSTVKSYIRFCLDHGHIEPARGQQPDRPWTGIVYRVIDVRAAAPIQRRDTFIDDHGRRCQQLWTAMRALKLFSVHELAVAASTDDLSVSDKRAREYVQYLSRAGYVVEIGQRLRRGVPARWKLMPAHNTGPLAPALIEQKTALYDRNLSRTVNLNEAEPRGRAA